jgi:hypothetical protein
MLKENQKKEYVINLYPDEIRSDKWRCVAFTKDGKSYIGVNIFSTEKAADLAAVECIRRTFDNPNFKLRALNGVFRAIDYSYHIPMPVKE